MIARRRLAAKPVPPGIALWAEELATLELPGGVPRCRTLAYFRSRTRVCGWMWLLAALAAWLTLAALRPPTGLASTTSTQLLFVSERSGAREVWVMESDGSGQRSLTGTVSGFAQDQMWSPDGNQVAFHGFPVPGGTIGIINADGTGLRKLLDPPISGSRAIHPAWSPDGARIALTVDVTASPPGPIADIYLVNVDGTSLDNLTDAPGNQLNTAPVWSPDGARLAFFSNRDGPPAPSLFTMATDGTDVSEVTGATGITHDHIRGFAWSREGNRFAYAADAFVPFGQSRVFVVNADGTGLTNLAQGRQPMWAPDGQRLVYVCDDLGGICTIEADGTGKTLIVSGARVQTPVWSPDGALIAYVAAEPNPQCCHPFELSFIEIVRPDGTGGVRLTTSGFDTLTTQGAVFHPHMVWRPGRLVYNFSGFFAPVDNSPIVNRANAGQTIPIKWRLTDQNGVPVSDPASFISVTSGSTSCDSGDPIDTVETYSGSSGLQYLGDGNWQFNWKTPKSYAGQCRIMRLNLADGGAGRTANFQFE